MKPDRECDLTDTQTPILQEVARFFESRAGDVIDKIHAGDLLELFAQMIRTAIDRACHFGQRKLFIRMFVDEIPRFPDFHRFGPMAIAR